MQRFKKTLYSQGTKEPKFQAKSRGRLFTYSDELTWKLFERLKLDRYYPHRLAVKFTRKRGETQLWSNFGTKTKIFKINKVMFDSRQTNTESLRRVTQMLRQAELDARAQGAKKIETDFTIISPRIAASFGYRAKETAGLTAKLCKYEKDLT